MTSRCLSDLVSLDRADYALDPEITASLQLKTDVARRTESRAEFGYDVAGGPRSNDLEREGSRNRTQKTQQST